MTNPTPPHPDQARAGHALEVRLARLLNIGTSLALGTALLGVALHLARGAKDPIDLTRFGAGVGSGYRGVSAVIKDSITGDALGVMQLSVLLLIATPFARVFFAMVSFAISKDRVYTLVAGLVLLGLALGLTGLVE